LNDFFADKRVLVTGGTGSIGAEIVTQLLEHGVQVVRVLSNDENSLFNMRAQLDDERLRYLLGDVRDEKRMRIASRDVELVFHAAALKHVPIGEYNPFELVQTNVIGTQNAISAALDENVERFLLIGTDKAVNPTSVLGASKLLCEKLVVDASAYRGNRRTRFASIRFGNVLNSRGSVLEVFQDQIRRGGPVTVTDREMTRFAISASQAVSCVLQAMATMLGGEIFVPKMQALRVMDLAETLVKELSPKYGLDPRKIAIETTKARPGEKTHEELMTDRELERCSELEDMYVVVPETFDLGGYGGYERPEMSEYASNAVSLMSKKDVTDLLKGLKGIGH
jgi:FlaA1/EpsC-like NDP-sugar epimerase